MAGSTVFIVSEDPVVRDSLSELVVSAGLRARMLSSLAAWFAACGSEPGGCLVLDAGMGDLVDPQRSARFAAACARIAVLVLTDRGDVPMAVRAIKQGAADVLQKPLQRQDVLERIKRAVGEKEYGGTAH
jgi:FixJ family two-component response regulator